MNNNNNSNKTIGVVGLGFVGGSIKTVLREKNINVLSYDKYKESEPLRAFSIEDLCARTRLIFVCVPTPMQDTGECDTSIVEEVISEINETNNSNIVIIKSTVPPGTTEYFNSKYTNTQIVFSPEFLRERTAIEDVRNQTRIIIGGPRQAATIVKVFMNKVFPNATVIKTNSTIAEMVKYMTNCFLATKLSFANEMYQICDKLDIDYDRVLECLLHDERFGKSHWQVPSLETDEDGYPLAGWSLSCFPKDLNALMYTAKQLGVDPKVMRAAWEKNLEVRPQRDWEKDERVKRSKK